mmetsp:Transcript_23631/g.52383  ORF Transcript_23631/g.52383 Transcript_23631/m.52383 type:complete len:155 (-) Transcript_23631:122-586(-)
MYVVLNIPRLGLDQQSSSDRLCSKETSRDWAFLLGLRISAPIFVLSFSSFLQLGLTSSTFQLGSTSFWANRRCPHRAALSISQLLLTISSSSNRQMGRRRPGRLALAVPQPPDQIAKRPQKTHTVVARLGSIQRLGLYFISARIDDILGGSMLF